MGFPQARIADHEDRLGFLDIVPTCQLEDLRLVLNWGRQEKSKSAKSFSAGNRAARINWACRFFSRWATSCSARANRKRS